LVWLLASNGDVPLSVVFAETRKKNLSTTANTTQKQKLFALASSLVAVGVGRPRPVVLALELLSGA